MKKNPKRSDYKTDSGYRRAVVRWIRANVNRSDRDPADPDLLVVRS